MDRIKFSTKEQVQKEVGKTYGRRVLRRGHEEAYTAAYHKVYQYYPVFFSKYTTFKKYVKIFLNIPRIQRYWVNKNKSYP